MHHLEKGSCAWYDVRDNRAQKPHWLEIKPPEWAALSFKNFHAKEGAHLHLRISPAHFNVQGFVEKDY